MSVYPILKYGNPLLLERSNDVLKFNTPELHKLIDNLKDTMLNNLGAGLAAPQIGVMQRVVVFGASNGNKTSRYPEASEIPETVLINPEIEVFTHELMGMWEGCLSVPGMRGYVERPNHIRYSGYNQYGEYFSREVKGFHAVVVQHECDHLDGILFPMKLKNLSLFGFESEVEKYQEAIQDKGASELCTQNN